MGNGEKRTYRMPGFRRDCCKILMSREIWRNHVKAFLRESESNTWGMAKREMIKEEWQLPAGLDQRRATQNKQQGQRKAVCLVKFLWEALNQQWLLGRVRQGSNHYRLFRSHQRKMEKESLEEWARSPMWCGYHRDRSQWYPGRAVLVLRAVNKLLDQTWRCQQVSRMKPLHHSCLFAKIKHGRYRHKSSRPLRPLSQVQGSTVRLLTCESQPRDQIPELHAQKNGAHVSPTLAWGCKWN